ncbi:MAG: DUF4867 family protein [Lachnospiraceae bacterium]|nr:DUF4867 family protein [Lachnospiraceae bacterium]
MEFLSVYSEAFKPYGQVLEGYDTAELLDAMRAIPLPETGTAYRPSIASLEYVKLFGKLQNNYYGGMPVQLGMCWGRNTKLNCLEYHRDSEVNVGTEDFVLLLAKQDEIEGGMLDTAKVKAFKVPADVAVEVYATTLHYAPCHLDEEKGFRVAVVLPRGTNTDRPGIEVANFEDGLLRACNKWLLAHPDSNEAKDGAYIGLKGENIDICK